MTVQCLDSAFAGAVGCQRGFRNSRIMPPLLGLSFADCREDNNANQREQRKKDKQGWGFHLFTPFRGIVSNAQAGALVPDGGRMQGCGPSVRACSATVCVQNNWPALRGGTAQDGPEGLKLPGGTTRFQNRDSNETCVGRTGSRSRNIFSQFVARCFITSDFTGFSGFVWNLFTLVTLCLLNHNPQLRRRAHNTTA